MTTFRTQALHPAYVLHARKYRDTSLILDLFSEDEGRYSVVARGARGEKSKLKGRLQPFAPLLVGYMGRGELKTATVIDFPVQAYRLVGEKLMLGLYVNELLYRLLGRFDPAPRLFAGYQRLLASLQNPDEFIEAVRHFEIVLLQELGYGINFDDDVVGGDRIVAERHYKYVVGEGFCRVDSTGEDVFLGAELQSISAGELNKDVLERLKHVTRASLRELLGDKPLKSRTLFRGVAR